MRIRHLWYHRQTAARAGWRGAYVTARPCDPERTIARLSGVPQPELGWFSRAVAWFTTPFKFLGLSGWVDTGCAGAGRGRLVRDAQHSTDGFWTLDVALEAFAIGDLGAPAGRFLRLECEPGTEAHRVCSLRPPGGDENLHFGGPIVIDTDGPFLEIHPDTDFGIVERQLRRSGAHAVTSGRSAPVIARERKRPRQSHP